MISPAAVTSWATPSPAPSEWLLGLAPAASGERVQVDDEHKQKQTHSGAMQTGKPSLGCPALFCGPSLHTLYNHPSLIATTSPSSSKSNRTSSCMPTGCPCCCSCFFQSLGSSGSHNDSAVNLTFASMAVAGCPGQWNSWQQSCKPKLPAVLALLSAAANVPINSCCWPAEGKKALVLLCQIAQATAQHQHSLLQHALTLNPNHSSSTLSPKSSQPSLSIPQPPSAPSAPPTPPPAAAAAAAAEHLLAGGIAHEPWLTAMAEGLLQAAAEAEESVVGGTKPCNLARFKLVRFVRSLSPVNQQQGTQLQPGATSATADSKLISPCNEQQQQQYHQQPGHQQQQQQQQQ